MAIGDSKTVGINCCVASGGYRDALAASLTTALPQNGVDFSGSMAQTGWYTSDVRTALPAFYATHPTTPDFILYNVGSNDLTAIRLGAVVEASWKSNAAAILDSLHTEFPTAQILIVRVYRTGYEVEEALLNDTWLTDVLATRGAFAAVGPDERTFLPGNTTDDTHPNVTGYALTAAAWQAAMGY